MDRFVSFLFCFLFINISFAKQSLKVKIDQGTLFGTTITTRGGREILAYLGIPYATPPIGSLRFKSPLPPPKWDGERDATKEGSICLQQFVLLESLRNITTGEEDCLYLNVFSPKLSSESKYPVMFYIHGGGYAGGSGSMKEYGPELLLDRDVVLVTINYRLGPLGFLSTSDSVLPGNLGLKDQRAALQWVKHNIAHFGGNPSDVTVFGESAGGASTHLHLLSPRSQGLLSRGISQSGTALCPWAYSSSARHSFFASKLARLVGCPDKPSQAFVDCLRDLPAEAIVSTQQYLIVWDMDPVVLFNPAIEPEGDDAFLTSDPWTLTSDKPWMVGFNQNEGSIKVSSLTQGAVAGKFKQLKDDFDSVLPMSLFYEYTAKNSPSITKAVRQYYFGGAAIPTQDMIPELIKLYTDAWFTAGTLEAARRHSGPLFKYYFSYENKNSFSLCSHYFHNPQYLGVCHFDELLYLFPMEGYAPQLIEDDPDFIMSSHMIQLWTNFATNNIPKLDRSEPFWHNQNGSVDDYLLISRGGMSLHQHLLEDQDNFWRKLPYHNKPLVASRKTYIDEL